MKRGPQAVLACAVGACSLFIGSVQLQAAAVFAPGSIIVFRAGDGVASADLHAKVAIQEYAQDGSLLETINLPATAGSTAFTIDRTAASDGTLTFSSDGRYLMFAGYNNATATGDSTDSVGGGTQRMMGRIDNDAIVGSPTPQLFQLGAIPGQIRGAVSSTNTTTYASVSSSSPRLIANGAASGSGTILTSSAGSRQISIFNGDLYASFTTATPGRGIYKYTGTPTTAAAPLTQLVAGDADDEFQSYFFADLDAGVAGVDTLWATELFGNTINKYSLVGGSWIANGTIPATGVRNIAAIVNGTSVSFFGASPTSVSSFVDSAGYNAANNGSFSAISGITPGANNVFKGIQVVVPEPTGLALLALGGMGLIGRRRRH